MKTKRTPLKKYRGTTSRAVAELGIENFNMTPENKQELYAYFVDGTRLKDSKISKQALFNRARLVANWIEDNVVQ